MQKTSGRRKRSPFGQVVLGGFLGIGILGALLWLACAPSYRTPAALPSTMVFGTTAKFNGTEMRLCGEANTDLAFRKCLANSGLNVDATDKRAYILSGNFPFNTSVWRLEWYGDDAESRSLSVISRSDYTGP